MGVWIYRTFASTRTSVPFADQAPSVLPRFPFLSLRTMPSILSVVSSAYEPTLDRRFAALSFLIRSKILFGVLWVLSFLQGRGGALAPLELRW